jgi:hypothetical protein
VCVLLMADVFFGERRRGLAPRLTLLLLAGGAAVTAFYSNVDVRVVLFGGSYVTDPLAVFLKLFGFVAIAVALLYSREYLERRGMMRGEYYVLALTSLLGIFVMVSANSPADRVHRRRTDVAVAVRHGGLRSRIRPGRRIGHEVFRPRRHRIGNAPIWHVAHLWHDRHAQPR